MWPFPVGFCALFHLWCAHTVSILFSFVAKSMYRCVIENAQLCINIIYYFNLLKNYKISAHAETCATQWKCKWSVHADFISIKCLLIFSPEWNWWVRRFSGWSKLSVSRCLLEAKKNVKTKSARKKGINCADGTRPRRLCFFDNKPFINAPPTISLSLSLSDSDSIHSEYARAKHVLHAPILRDEYVNVY